jgi:hypothetical protein
MILTGWAERLMGNDAPAYRQAPNLAWYRAGRRIVKKVTSNG